MYKYYFAFLCCLVTIVSCNKETTTLNLTPISQIYPLSVGKTFLYRLDSTVPIEFGKKLVVKSYLAKDSIESSFLDANGNQSFRIFRYITDTMQLNAWQFSATNIATINNNKIEYIENNLRYIKLVNPVSTNTTWKGNSYINTQLQTPYYYLDNWDYQYQKIDEPFTCLRGTFDTTYTIMQHNSQTPSAFDATIYNEKEYSIEVYAKGVGLIYKDFLYYIWQPTPSPKFQDDAYGVRLNLISYK